MRVGDVLEWLAGGSAVTAAYLGTGELWVAFAAGSVFAFYQAQCLSKSSFSWPRVRRPGWLKLPRKRAES